MTPDDRTKRLDVHWARKEIEQAKAEFQTARDKLAQAKRHYESITGRANAPQGTVDANRRRARRDHYLRKHPELRSLPLKKRRAALDAIIDSVDKPRVYSWTFDWMKAGKVVKQDRDAFKLYRAALKLWAHQLRVIRQVDRASIVEGHLSTLTDTSPRAVECTFPTEWREISQALRPVGSNPSSRHEKALFVIYQHIIRTRKVGSFVPSTRGLLP